MTITVEAIYAEISKSFRSGLAGVERTGPFPASSGSFSRNTFSYVPHLRLYVALPLAEYVTVRFGFDFFYWSHVARAVDQVDLTTVGGAPSSGEVIRDRGLIATSLDLGLQLRF
jgi:hypothetical protein